MKVQKRIYDMTDRELRIYKREQRRRKVLRRRCLISILTICFVLAGTVSYHAFRSSANTGTDKIHFKYYTNISVEYGETLWELADEYIDYEMYVDKDAYISEVVSINHLEDGNSLQEGQKLIVPYYSAEFVK